MNFPFVIDNVNYTFLRLLTTLLESSKGICLDAATDLISIGGFEQLKNNLYNVSRLRLLFLAEPSPTTVVQLPTKIIPQKIQLDLRRYPFNRYYYELVRDMIECLSDNKVEIRIYYKGFQKGNCYLIYKQQTEQGKILLQPLAGILGSSSLTAEGLTSPYECNFVHRTINSASVEPTESGEENPENQSPPAHIELKPMSAQAAQVGAVAFNELRHWFENRWKDAWKYKSEFINMLNASKFGNTEYSPHHIYMKTLYEYMKDSFILTPSGKTKPGASLEEFETVAYHKMRMIIQRYRGVMLADSLGLSKQGIVKTLLGETPDGNKTLLLCTAGQKELWQSLLANSGLNTSIVTHEELCTRDFAFSGLRDMDLVIVDESHNFSNPNTQRFINLKQILDCNETKTSLPDKPVVIFLTSSPLVKGILDLYHQLYLLARGNKALFSDIGVPDFSKLFLKAHAFPQKLTGIISVFNVLEAIVIRRTRWFARKDRSLTQYMGKSFHFPKRQLKTVYYPLKETYLNHFERFVTGIQQLELPFFYIEPFKNEHASITVDTYLQGREQAIRSYVKMKYLMRMESSSESIRMSLKRLLGFTKALGALSGKNKYPDSKNFTFALNYLAREDDEDSGMSPSFVADTDDATDLRITLERSGILNSVDLDSMKFSQAITHDEQILNDLLPLFKDMKPETDGKLLRLKKLLFTELRDKKILLFTNYRDTARYLYWCLGHPNNPEAVKFCNQMGNCKIRMIDASQEPTLRNRIIQGFAGHLKDQSDDSSAKNNVDILIATDVLAESIEFPLCDTLINYDSLWNATKLLQRLSPMEVVGNTTEQVTIYSFYPEKEYDAYLEVLKSLNNAVTAAERAGSLEISALGTALSPKNWEVVVRIRKEDALALDEVEQFSELLTLEGHTKRLSSFLSQDGLQIINSIPHGVHSGFSRQGSTEGVFMFFQTSGASSQIRSFWRFYNPKTQRISDNIYLIINALACDDFTARDIPDSAFPTIFDVQEKVIADILSQSESKPDEKSTEPTESTQLEFIHLLKQFEAHPELQSVAIPSVIRFFSKPLSNECLEQMKQILAIFEEEQDLKLLSQQIEEIQRKYPHTVPDTPVNIPSLKREELELISFAFLR